MRNINIEEKISAEVLKLNPQRGDFLVFYLKTDENGEILMNVEIAQKIFDCIKQGLENQQVSAMVFPDYIHVNVENVDDVKEELKRLIEKLEVMGAGIEEKRDELRKGILFRFNAKDR